MSVLSVLSAVRGCLPNEMASACTQTGSRESSFCFSNKKKNQLDRLCPLFSILSAAYHSLLLTLRLQTTPVVPPTGEHASKCYHSYCLFICLFIRWSDFEPSPWLPDQMSLTCVHIFKIKPLSVSPSFIALVVLSPN